LSQADAAAAASFSGRIVDRPGVSTVQLPPLFLMCAGPPATS
jgi:hypothetical protein